MKNTMIKVLSFVIALTMIAATFGTISVFAAEGHTHVQGALIEKVEATCINPGFTRYECTDPNCPTGEYVADFKAASADLHDYQFSPAEPASCLQNSFTAGYKCVHCNDVPEGSTRVEGNDQKLHVFVGTESAATCTADGKVTYKCAICQKTAEWLKTNNKLIGDQATDYATKYADKKTDDKLGHNYVWTVEKSAKNNTTKACEDGLAKGVCANCGDTKTQVIPAHTDVVWEKINPSNHPCVVWNADARWCKFCHAIHPEDADEVKETFGHAMTDTNIYNGTFTAAFVNANEGITFEMLYAWGYELNQDITDRATCTEAGYVLYKCACGEIIYTVEPAKNHTYVDGAYIEPTDCTQPIMRTQTCSDCGETRQVQHAPAQFTSHKDVAASSNVTATCNRVGVTTINCGRKITVNGIEYPCAHSTTAYASALEHEYGTAKKLYSGGCTNGVWVVTCTQPGCAAFNNAAGKNPLTTGYYKETEAPTGDAVKHTWGSKVTYAGTCTEKNYYTQQCTKCNYYRTAADAANTTAGSATEYKLYESNAAKAPNNHNYVHFGWANEANKPETLCGPIAAGAEYIERVYCADCQTADLANTITRVFTPYAHATADVKAGYITYDVNGDPEFNAGGRDAKCNQVGYKDDGKVCTECMTVVKAPTEIAKKPDVHAEVPADSDKVGAIVPATCKAAAYQNYFYSCCNKTLPVTLSGGDYDKKTCEDGYVLQPANAPTCTAKGNHAYYKCKWCGGIKANSVVVDGCAFGCSDAFHFNAKLNNTYEIPAIDHDFTVDVEFRAEDPTKRNDARENDNCFIPYTQAHKACANGCTVVLFNGTQYDLSVDAQKTSFEAAARVLPHGVEANKKVVTDAQAYAATCATPGLKAGTYCEVCQAGEWVIPATNAHVYTGYTAEQELTKVFRANMIKVDGTWVVKNCKEASIEIFECKNCSERHIESKTDAKTSHTWSAWSTPAAAGPVCKFDTTKTRTCTACAAGVTSETEVTEAARGCYTTKGLADKAENRFKLSRKCDEIANFFGWKCDKCGETMSKELAQHTPVTDYAPATCTSDGYEINYCKGCGLTHTNKAVAFYGYTRKVNKPSGALLEYVDDNGDPILDYEHDYVNGIILENVAPTYEAAGYIKFICADCDGTFTKTVDKLEAPLNATYTVSDETVSAGTEFTVTLTYSAKAVTLHNTVVVVPAFDTTKLEFVGMKANADLEAAGLYAQAAVRSDNKIGVSLVVSNDELGNERDITTDVAGTEILTLTFKVKDSASGSATVAGLGISIVGLGNLNGDAQVDGNDVRSVFALIKNQDAAADVNKDGMVDIQDAAALSRFVAEGKTSRAYLKMIKVYDAAAIEDAAYALANAGKILDHNNDGNFNVADVAKLLEKIEAGLNGDYTTLKADTVDALVAYYNAH